MPADNVWRADVSGLPVHPKSAAFVESIGAGATMHPDFGSGLWEGAPIGIPVTTVRAGQAKRHGRLRVRGGERPRPVPDPARREDRGRARTGPATGTSSSTTRPRAGRTSSSTRTRGRRLAGRLRRDLRPADQQAAPGRLDLGRRGRAVDLRRAGAVRGGRGRPHRPRDPDHGAAHPHRVHLAGPALGPSTHRRGLPQMGQRLRLKAGVDTSRMPQQARVVAEAMKRYGVIVADHGSPWYISGAPDKRWDNDALRALKGISGRTSRRSTSSGLLVSKTPARSERVDQLPVDRVQLLVGERRAGAARRGWPPAARRCWRR